MSVSPLSSGRTRFTIGIVWLVLLADHTGLLIWYGYSFKTAIIDSFVGNFHLLLATLLLINTFRFYLPRKDRYIFLIAWCILLTAVTIVLSRWAITSFLRREPDFIEFFDQSLIIRVCLYLLIICCVALISMIWYNLREQEENERRNQDTEKLAKEAELFKLRQQLQPHFLFNSLNSINALISSQPTEARKMVQQLSEFLRGTLKKEEQQWVTLSEELEYLQLYLEIEKVRFGNRLTTIIESDEAPRLLKMPAMILQPIMENAIKFGLYDITGEIEIRLSAYKEDHFLILKVQNPFDPETSSPREGTGFGLQSVQRRLYLLFARNDLLKTEIKENIFITTLKIPQYD